MSEGSLHTLNQFLHGTSPFPPPTYLWKKVFLNFGFDLYTSDSRSLEMTLFRPSSDAVLLRQLEPSQKTNRTSNLIRKHLL